MATSTNLHLGDTVAVKGNTLTTGEVYLDIQNGRGYSSDNLAIFLPKDPADAIAVLGAIAVQAYRLRDILANSRGNELS